MIKRAALCVSLALRWPRSRAFDVAVTLFALSVAPAAATAAVHENLVKVLVVDDGSAEALVRRIRFQTNDLALETKIVSARLVGDFAEQSRAALAMAARADARILIWFPSAESETLIAFAEPASSAVYAKAPCAAIPTGRSSVHVSSCLETTALVARSTLSALLEGASLVALLGEPPSPKSGPAPKPTPPPDAPKAVVATPFAAAPQNAWLFAGGPLVIANGQTQPGMWGLALGAARVHNFWMGELRLLGTLASTVRSQGVAADIFEMGMSATLWRKIGAFESIDVAFGLPLGWAAWRRGTASVPQNAGVAATGASTTFSVTTGAEAAIAFKPTRSGLTARLLGGLHFVPGAPTFTYADRGQDRSLWIVQPFVSLQLAWLTADPRARNEV
ncbi:MAG: hypothetical protein KA712_07675 [Myxococcales bacterium]|nr:hypothetical protein [Myxococcales bacterium]